MGVLKTTAIYAHRAFPVAVTQELGASNKLGTMVTPPFHVIGIWSHILFSMARGGTVVLWAPVSPPPVPTAESALASMRATGCNTIMVVPSFFVSWAHDKEAVKFLSRMDIVVRFPLVMSQLFEIADTCSYRFLVVALCHKRLATISSDLGSRW